MWRNWNLATIKCTIWYIDQVVFFHILCNCYLFPFKLAIHILINLIAFDKSFFILFFHFVIIIQCLLFFRSFFSSCTNHSFSALNQSHGFQFEFCTELIFFCLVLFDFLTEKKIKQALVCIRYNKSGDVVVVAVIVGSKLTRTN